MKRAEATLHGALRYARAMTGYVRDAEERERYEAAVGDLAWLLEGPRRLATTGPALVAATRVCGLLMGDENARIEKLHDKPAYYVVNTLGHAQRFVFGGWPETAVMEFLAMYAGEQVKKQEGA